MYTLLHPQWCTLHRGKQFGKVVVFSQFIVNIYVRATKTFVHMKQHFHQFTNAVQINSYGTTIQYYQCHKQVVLENEEPESFQANQLEQLQAREIIWNS